jgi:O-Antigen ligase
MTGRHAPIDPSEAPVKAAGSSPRVGVAPWMYALALALWASSWNLRNSVLMAWLPFEPVWLGSAAVALCVVHRLGQPLRLDTAVTGPLLLLMVGFLPGALLSSGGGYGPVKVSTMIFVLLPVLCAAILLLDSPAARLRWVWAQVLIGIAVALAALESNHTSIIEPGRFTLASVDTISFARLVGVAVVALLLIGLGSLKRSWWTLPLAAGSGMVLVHVGSRGPLLSALLTVLIVVVAGRCFAGRRVVLVLLVIAANVAAYLYALTDGGSGGKRIIESLQAGLSDDTRAHLLNDAIRLGTTHPMGIGWGDFAQDSRAGRQIANDQGVAYAHNVFAESFAEGGVFAVLALLLVVVLALSRLHRLSSDPQEAVVFGTLVYWLLNAQISSDLVGNRFMWIALACGLASYADASRLRARRNRLRATPLPESVASG